MQNNKFLWPKAGSHDDQAHPPIHPTRNVELNDLEDPDEKKIYELVTIHFLACCAQDAKGQTKLCYVFTPSDVTAFSCDAVTRLIM
jgi:DNA topoisomerase IA